MISVDWLPELVAQGVIRDVFRVRLPSLVRRTRGEAKLRKQNGGTPGDWQGDLDEGRVKSRADLARRLGLSRARVTQVLGPQVAS